MAQLDWRNVAAPDFSGSAEGFRTFSNLLDSAFGGLKQSVTRFDATQADKINQELMRTAMGFTDAAAFQAALPGMLQDPRAARLSAENLQFLGSRANDLLQTEGNRLRNQDTQADMGWETKQRGRTEGEWAAEDAVQPYATEALRLAAEGNDAGARAVWARPEAQTALSRMDPTKAAAIISGEFRIGADRRGLRDSDQRFETNQFDFNEKRETVAEREQAESVVAQLLPRATTLEEAESLIYGSAGYKALAPGAQLAADEMIRSRFPNAAPMIAAAAGDAGTGGAPAGGYAGGASNVMDVVNYEARGRGFTTVPSNIQTYDQLQQYGRRMVQGTNGEGSSATGPFQITYSTRDEFAPRVLGANWRTMPRTVENEDKIAEAIFNASRGSAAALRGRWVSLSPAEAERVRRMPWSEAKNIIARGESGVDLTTLNASANAAQAQITDRRAQTPIDDLLVSYAQAAQVRLDPAAAAATLTVKGGALEGANRADAVQAVNHVAERYGVTHSVAASLIKNNVERRGAIDFRRNLGGLVLDHDGIRADAELMRNGGLQRGTVALQTREGVSASIETARAAAAAANAELIAARRRQEVRPDLDISRYIQRDQQARQAFLAAQAASQDPGVGYQPPVAPTPVAQTWGRPNGRPPVQVRPASSVFGATSNMRLRD